MSNILSIDVGIKNLSFCLLRLNNEQSGQNREIEILKWNTLNLNDALNTDIDTDTGTDVTKVCTCKIGCKLKPYYVYTQDNNVVYACKRHYKTVLEPSRRVFENKPPSYISKVLKTFTAENLREFCKEYSFENTNANEDQSTTGNVKLVKQELKMKALTVLRTEYVYPISTHANCISILQFPDQKEEQIQQKQQIQKKNKNLSQTQASTVSLVFVGYSLMKQFDELFYNENCPDQNKNKIDAVVIENQISPIANRMKTVQGMITQYFLMRGVNKDHIIYFSSVQKLKVAPYHFIFHDTSDKNNVDDDADEVDDIQTYDDRKKAGVACVRKILAGSSTSSTSTSMTGSGSSPFTIQSNECTHSNTKLCSCWLHRFESHKKKDDMADSFLQGLSYIVKTAK
jgi:hypothetical protein